MIVELNSNWRKIIKKPNNWIDEFSDTALIKIEPVTSPHNPLLIMVGKDTFTEEFYVVVEDNDVSQDIYPQEGETLYDVFMNVYNRHVHGDELLTELYAASIEANVKLTFTDESGNKVEPNQKTIAVLNEVLEKCCLPFIADMIATAYSKKKLSTPKEMYVQEMEKYLNDIMTGETIGFTYHDEDGNEIDMDDDACELVKVILKKGYIPYISRYAVGLGYRRNK